MAAVGGKERESSLGVFALAMLAGNGIVGLTFGPKLLKSEGAV
jgi:hypothetical protein